jgi:hypothetical protein
MKILLISFCVLCTNLSFSQDTLKLNFLYGSKPAKDFKDSESKVFGGLKGGHVNIEVKGKVLDFMPGKNPLFPKNSNPSGGFQLNQSVYWDTVASKWITILIPVSNNQMKQLETIFDNYSQKTPYDYAIFGMRCAAASYDVLSEIGLVKKIDNNKNVLKNFYPKLFRKRMLKWAKNNGFTILYHQGKSSRKWEKDKGIL